MIQWILKNKLALVVLLALLAVYAGFLLHEVTLVTADLGRHIENGKQLMAGNTEVLTTNFYSYTQPDFPFLNHHWLSGVIFYGIWSTVGFSGLHLFFVLVSLAAFALLFWFSHRRYGLAATSAVALAVMPLVVQRAEIRPEVFSYLFAALFFILLTDYLRPQGSKLKVLVGLPLMMVVWVNLHLYFVFGIGLVGAFLLGTVISKRWKQSKTLAGALGLTILATLVNPFLWRGALGLFYTLQEYGYRLVENQPIWFLEGRIANPNLTTFKIIFGLLLVGFLLVALQKYKKLRWEYVFIALGISVMGWLALRNLTLFGLFAIPLFSHSIATLYPKIATPGVAKKIVGVVVTLALFILIGGLAPVFPHPISFNAGVAEADSAGADFIKEYNIAGPLFNNYDIGGYLIFHLYPEWRVFVDNRPEAYSTSFLQERYIPMQENNERWQAELEKENFNAIIFYYRDATSWGQTFLKQRIDDPAWAPVFVDERVIVLIRRTPKNQDIIEKHEIPRERFSTS